MKNNKNLWVILVVIFLYAIGMTIVFPLFPFLLQKYLPESQIAIGVGLLYSVYAAAQFFTVPIFGALSDRYGRRPVLIASLIGSIIGYLLLGTAGALWMLFLGRIIDGITAGDITALFAYITDSTEEKDRTKWFSYVGATIGIGMMIGPGIGGLLGAISINLPFFVTAGLFALTTLCVFFFLPESLAPDKRSSEFNVKHLNVFSHFREVFAMPKPKELLIVGFFFYVGLGLYQMNMSVFMKDVFLWGPGAIGGILSLVGVCDIISRSVILPLALKRWSVRALGIVGLSMLTVGLGMVFLSASFVSAGLLIAGVACITLGEGFFDPPYNTSLSTSVDESSQGLLQGVNQSLQSGYRTLIPLVASGLYFLNRSLVYGVAAFLMIVAVRLFSKVRPSELTAEA